MNHSKSYKEWMAELQAIKSREYHLFLDLDGVLADFDVGFFKIKGRKHRGTPGDWQVISPEVTPNFFANLPWTPDGKDLWNYCKDKHPIIHTGVPRGNWGKPQKLAWVRRELGEHVPVITGFARNKCQVAGPNHILVDDRADNIEDWIRCKGIGIFHVSASESIRKLRAIYKD